MKVVQTPDNEKVMAAMLANAADDFESLGRILDGPISDVLASKAKTIREFLAGVNQ